MDNSPRFNDDQADQFGHAAGHLDAVDLNAYLFMDLRMLALMARELGKEEEAVAGMSAGKRWDNISSSISTMGNAICSGTGISIQVPSRPS